MNKRHLNGVLIRVPPTHASLLEYVAGLELDQLKLIVAACVELSPEHVAAMAHSRLHATHEPVIMPIWVTRLEALERTLIAYSDDINHARRLGAIRYSVDAANTLQGVTYDKGD